MHQSSLPKDFDPVVSINSGQVFLWEKNGNSWYGIHGDHVIKFTVTYNDRFEFSSFPESTMCKYYRIFRLDDNINKILDHLSHDPFMHRLVRMYPGLRLMRQDPYQCLFSFLCASNTSIPMIRRMLYLLTRKFGSRVQVDGKDFFTFPSATSIHRASINELRSCSLGYRIKAIKAAAELIVSGKLDFDLLKRASYERAKQELLQIYGVGNKIADCILLFSLEKLDAFPIDVWIARALASHYARLYKIKFSDKITCCQYRLLSDGARKYFGMYAGYAQQYIYYHMRQDAGKKW